MGINNHKKEYKLISEKLRLAREAVGLNQGRVAAKIEKSQSYISKIESGKIDIGAVELNLLAKIYKKPIGYFLP